MSEKKKYISVQEFVARMKAIRKRPIDPKFIEKFNELMKKDIELEREQKSPAFSRPYSSENDVILNQEVAYMSKPRKPFSTLAKDLKKIRKRPLTQAEIDRANKVFDRIEKESTKPSHDKTESPLRKIAKSPEVES